jgi:hypothetical protein
MEAQLDRIESALSELTKAPPPPGVADVVGRLAHISRWVNEIKRDLLAEAGPERGMSYQLVGSRAATRSYNTPALIAAFAAEGVGLPDLVQGDVVRLDWRWTELKRAAYDAGVTLRIAPREIADDDLDGPMVGEVWRDELRVEAV